MWLRSSQDDEFMFEDEEDAAGDDKGDAKDAEATLTPADDVESKSGGVKNGVKLDVPKELKRMQTAMTALHGKLDLIMKALEVRCLRSNVPF